MKKKIEIISIMPMTDGVEIEYKENGIPKKHTAPHAEFRPWSFRNGYWIEAYYKFLDNMQKGLVAKKYLIDKIYRDEPCVSA